ncbi:DNA-deoxyinosine glycosylase [Sandarakinorhabdus sp. DWP1-3-1]|uniref:DNA-deoxyinosine glycosylase n=1 Tax=Sandarakinorhabdus sp. DWP1-3-1 TaxID=2804627 RepID=UPI003CF463FF
MNLDRSFGAAAGPGTRLLILGSLPGQASLAAQQYYAHPRNGFWPLVGAVIDADLVALPYPVRLAALAAAGIGLWDVVGAARRPGSLDSAIRDVEANDLAKLAASLPALRTVAFNGATAWRLGAPLLAGTELELLRLPSSSPAHAAMPFDRKRAAWLLLRDRL